MLAAITAINFSMKINIREVSDLTSATTATITSHWLGIHLIA
jgi:hypothetical protein